MNISVNYSSFNNCTVITTANDEFLPTEEERVQYALDLLDVVIDLASNSTKRENELPQKLLEEARDYMNP